MTPVSVRTFGAMYGHTFQITRSDIRPYKKWAVSLVHMVTLIFLRGLCGYVWDNILTLSHECVHLA